MAKVLKCNDVVPGCAAEMRGNSDDEVLRQAVEHARSAHGMQQIDPATAQKVQAAIRSEG